MQSNPSRIVIGLIVAVRLRLAINRVEIREVSSIDYRISGTHFQTIRTFLHSVDSGDLFE